ncbi:hypothetical protein EVAR_138_1 [Eumeta japonica]|uniref:Pre-C2HC domain-containing protein n=1 Tax=Eumeta variegata TaxID=151549 RepID=A0A4C1S8J1_EUMVA|nr:hypothetical protein EVAR_138_1 [Eumeta japonica]
MEVELNPIKELTKRPATVRLSEDFVSDSDPRWSDDYSNFTSVQRRKTSRAKPEPDSASWRKLFQPSVASQGTVVEKPDKAAESTPAKNANIKKIDETGVTTSPTPAPHGPTPPPVFGLKLQAKTVAHRNLQNLLVTQGYAFHTYSLKEEREIRVVLRGVLREIPIEEVKEDLRSQNLPVQSVRRILNRSREPFDLVLVSGTAEANDKATKTAFFKTKSVCHTTNYRGRSRAPKRGPPAPEKAAPCRAPARAASNTLSYARAAMGPRSVPPASKQNQSSTTDDLKQLMSIMSIIDTNKLATQAKKLRAAANPTEKLISLIEHASFVEAIKNNKF